MAMTGPSRETLRQLRTWRREAARYDTVMAKTERGMLAGTREWLGARAVGRVLEVAVGTGRTLPYYRDVASLTAIDLTPEMLAVARSRAEHAGIEVELSEADAEALPFPDARFDTVVCALALCSIPHPDAAVAEMRRVLVPGGTLLLADHIGSTWPPVYALQWLMERWSVPVRGEHLTRRHLSRVEATGFRVVERERLKAGMVERIRAIRP
ncbi:methyltransferase domain-containing protein [Leifsonia sp. F6_8S_P_1B]|uniref:Methyltransferase domain-containing protein n=1 Tax=Leifsonia williamsii TaxID=3035919 RepID=A0ABT8K712_9MICO|nr:methyltransferase domain-containing protein [Leifsonia williamsii]MDN4613235.1 methyltransferase domain-containing protein [Leifsonia williamsii]